MSALSAAAQGAAYLLTQRSWMSRIGTGLRKCSFSRPRRRVVTSRASSSTRRCFITPKRVIGKPRLERAERLPVLLEQRVEQAPPRRIGQRLEDGVHLVNCCISLIHVKYYT